MHTSLKIWLCSFILLLATCPEDAFAEKVSLQKALECAQAFWNQSATRSGGDLRLSWDSRSLDASTRNAEEQDPLFYVFEHTDGSGFVIVSAEDRTKPILAYSFDDGLSSSPSLPENLTEWFHFIQRQIQSVRETSTTRAATADAWTATRAGKTVVELTTAKWNQVAPYNDQCPLDGQTRSMTGCVATAVSILMRYHEWPEAGIGETNAYTTSTRKLQVDSRNLAHTYQWDLMPLTDITNASAEAIEQVSGLMADVGAAFQSDYAQSGTAVWMSPSALYEHFDYSAGMHSIYRQNREDKVWLSLLKDELSASRPIIYMGYTQTYGHVFILDGYTDDNYFHVNWGWGGQYNGYFTLDNLLPAPFYHDPYSYYQAAYIPMKPRADEAIENWVIMYDAGIRLPDTLDFASTNTGTITSVTLLNDSGKSFTGSVRAALTDSLGTLKEWVSRSYTTKISPTYYITLNRISIQITQNKKTGDRIRFFYQPSGSDEWTLITSLYDTACQWEITWADEPSIAQSTSFAFDREKRIITLQTKEGVTATLYTASGTEVTAGMTVDGSTITLDATLLPSGTYKLKLQKDEDLKELTITLKPLKS